MMMADKSASSQHDDDKDATVDHIDLSYAPRLRSSASRASSRGRRDHDRRACNLDSGYNTDVSPAATTSPATNSTRQQHFVFDNINQIPELEDRNYSISHISPFLASGNVVTSSLTPGLHPPYQLHFEHRSRSTPPLRLSPDIFKVCASPGRTVCPETQTSRTVSETSDTNRTLLDSESDAEEDSSNRRENNNAGNKIVASPKKSGDHFGSSEDFMGLHLPSICHESDDGDDEDVFYNSDEVLKNFGVSSEPQTLRCRSNLSLRQRRYCSANDNSESLLGACGGHDANEESTSFGPNQSSDQRRRSFSDSSGGGNNDRRSYVRNSASGSAIENGRYIQQNIACRHNESAVSSRQYLRPGYFDVCDTRVRDSDNIYHFIADNIGSLEDCDISQSNSRDASLMPILVERPANNSGTQWRLSVRACLRLSSGHLLPWSTSRDSVSVSTQTPHMTSIMIHQILDTPSALPNEARGAVADHLRRRQSESGLLQTASSRQLPDIIPSGRDRAMSVPDLQTLARMQRAREVGRELRRLSDEFHFGAFLSTIHEDVDGHLPRLSGHFLRNPFSHIWTALRQTFRPRRRRRPVNRSGSTSVDLAGSMASMHLAEHAEDLPGD